MIPQLYSEELWKNGEIILQGPLSFLQRSTFYMHSYRWQQYHYLTIHFNSTDKIFSNKLITFLHVMAEDKRNACRKNDIKFIVISTGKDTET